MQIFHFFMQPGKTSSNMSLVYDNSNVQFFVDSSVSVCVLTLSTSSVCL